MVNNTQAKHASSDGYEMPYSDVDSEYLEPYEYMTDQSGASAPAE